MFLHAKYVASGGIRSMNIFSELDKDVVVIDVVVLLITSLTRELLS